VLIDAVKRYEKLAKESERILPNGKAIVIELKPFKFKKFCCQFSDDIKEHFSVIEKYNYIIKDILNDIVGTNNIKIGIASYGKISLIIEGKDNNTFYGRDMTKIASLYSSIVAREFALRSESKKYCLSESGEIRYLPSFTAEGFAIDNEEINEYIDVQERSNERNIINKITDDFIEKKRVVKTSTELEELLLSVNVWVDVKYFIHNCFTCVSYKG
jgi:tRNA(His) 5'-end guanylyltransferase